MDKLFKELTQINYKSKDKTRQPMMWDSLSKC